MSNTDKEKTILARGRERIVEKVVDLEPLMQVKAFSGIAGSPVYSQKKTSALFIIQKLPAAVRNFLKLLYNDYSGVEVKLHYDQNDIRNAHSLFLGARVVSMLIFEYRLFCRASAFFSVITTKMSDDDRGIIGVHILCID